MQKVFRYIVFLIFLLHFIPGNIIASITDPQPQILFNKIYLDDNYGVGTVEAFEQDSFGFIWIGAKDGLIRYDGTDFHTYTYDRSDTSSLSSNVIRDLLRDSNGNLWVGTEYGLNRYQVETDNFIRYVNNPGGNQNIQDLNIRKLVEDSSGNIWIAARSEGILRFSPKTNTFTSLGSLLMGGDTLPTFDIRTIFLDSQNNLWIGTADQGVYWVNTAKMQLHVFPSGKPDGKHVNGTDIRAIVQAKDGKIWFGSNNKGISLYSPANNSFSYFNTDRIDKARIESNIIWNLYIDSQETVWACTDGGGLLKFDRKSKKFNTHRASLNDRYSLSSDVVRVFFEDNAGNFWVGNFNAPVNFVDGHRKQFHTLRHILPDENMLNQDKVTSLLSDHEGYLWIATDGDGVIRYNTEDGSYSHYLQQPGVSSSLVNSKAICLDIDSEGNVWIGHFEGGISCYNKKSGKFKQYLPGENNFRGTQIWDLEVDGDNILVASNLGLEKLDVSTGEFAVVDFSNTGTPFDHHGVWHIFTDSQDRLFIGTYNGLFVYNGEALKHFLPIANNTSSLSDKWVLTVFEDPERRIWIGTNGGGLNLWDGENGFKCFTMQNGLAGNKVSAIECDADNNLWISTNKGLSRFVYDSLRFTNFTIEDGLQGNQFNYNAVYKTPEQKIFFGGNQGITYFDPQKIVKSDFIPPIVFTGFEVIGKDSKKLNALDPINSNILIQEVIHLYPEHKIFTIKFAALNYAQSQKIRYMYKLEGFDKEWHSIENQNRASYTNIMPGKYKFHVTASNPDGIWNDDHITKIIIVHPPFYRRAWFIAFLILVIVSLIAVIYKMRIDREKEVSAKLSKIVSDRTKQLELRNKEISEQRDIAQNQRDQIRKQNEELEQHRNRLEELVEERTQDLMIAKNRAEESDKLKTAFLENLSHEIRTPMNAIIGFINLLTEKIDDKNSRDYYLRIINESGRNMLHLIQDIIDFSRMQTGELQPEYAECRVNESIKELITSARVRASREKPELNIIASLPDEDVSIYSDEKKIKAILSKLLENSLKFTKEGHIKIGVRSIEEKWITFFVQDSGVKIKAEYRDIIFDRFFTVQEEDNSDEYRGSGLGLAFAKVIVELLGGQIWVESQEDQDTYFCFKLPLMRISTVSEKEAPGNAKRKYYWEGKKVLVAEDEDSNYLLIEAILKDTGVKLIHCMDGVELLEKIDAGLDYDIVLLDLKMPRMGGINAMKLIRESNADLPVIVQTAYDQTNHRQQAIELGCNDFLVKPLRKKELLDTMEKYLG